MKALVAGFACFVLVAAQAQACSVSGTAFTPHGKKMSWAVVRLIDLDANSAVYTTADENAAFSFNGASSGQRMRIDIISPPTVVTGSHVPTRSIMGQSETFSCANSQMMQDVHSEYDN